MSIQSIKNKAVKLYNRVVNGKVITYDGQGNIIGNGKSFATPIIGIVPKELQNMPEAWKNRIERSYENIWQLTMQKAAQEPVGGFAPQRQNSKPAATQKSMSAQIDEMMREIESDKTIPSFEKTNIKGAFHVLKTCVNTQGKLDEKLLTNDAFQTIQKHLEVVSGNKPKPVSKPLIQPTTRPAAASTPAPVQPAKPVVKKKPLAEVKQAIYCNPEISFAARPYAVNVAEIKDRYTDANGVFNEKNMTQEDAFLLRRSTRKLSELSTKQSTK